MKSKEFDDLVRQSFDNARLPYNPENWQKLAAVLPEKKSRGIRYLLLPFASVAASVAMAIGITTWVNHPDDAGVVQKSAATSSHVAQSSVQRNASTPVAEDVTPIEPLGAHQALPVVHRTHKPHQQDIPVENKAEEKPVEEILIASNTKPTLETNTSNVFYQNITPAKKEKRTYMSMNGGYNYGTLKSGYSMGFSVGRKLNDQFYLEADVALVGNMAGSNTRLSFTTGNPATTGKYTDAPAQITKTVEVQKYYNIFYAQVAPSIGMKLSHKVSVGMGADVQRLLMDKKLTIQTSDAENNQKQLPMYDMGLNVKTEYSLTKEIKASLQYRKGMTQVLSGDKQMLDRDYLQLQLKFNILNR
jgi:hypothetical protein